jgi:hypothetical protein
LSACFAFFFAAAESWKSVESDLLQELLRLLDELRERTWLLLLLAFLPREGERFREGLR